MLFISEKRTAHALLLSAPIRLSPLTRPAPCADPEADPANWPLKRKRSSPGPAPAPFIVDILCADDWPLLFMAVPLPLALADDGCDAEIDGVWTADINLETPPPLPPPALAPVPVPAAAVWLVPAPATRLPRPPDPARPPGMDRPGVGIGVGSTVDDVRVYGNPAGMGIRRPRVGDVPVPATPVPVADTDAGAGV